MGNLEKSIYKVIFEIDMGVNVAQDEKRLNAAKEIAENQINFICWYSGMNKEKVLKAFERYINEQI